MQLILLSGLAGSGKSIALKVLEDSGYYCVDNLPVKLLPDIVHYLKETDCRHVAISVDVRSGVSVRELPHQIAQLKTQGIDVRLLYLEAGTETLVKRFSETRRRHPLSDNQLTLPECIKQENDMLCAVGDHAHRIDTSELDPNALRTWIKDFIHLDRSRLTLLFQSFGFKGGLPLDADCVFDVRCLPNPNYDPTLRALTGRDIPVIAFLEQQEPVMRMLDDIRSFIEQWLPCFIRDNRNYLTVAIGCTGGQHRSVYIAEKLAEYFRRHQQVMVRHRGLS